jgi:hypothetical protein
MRPFFGFVCVWALLASCGDGDPPASRSGDLASCVASGQVGSKRPGCPTDPAPPDNDCATASPFYDDVAPIFASRCSVCHHSGGLETMYIFDTYAQVHDNTTVRTRILTQIFGCRMPPPCAPDLTASERATMLKWLVCGGPESRDAGSD